MPVRVIIAVLRTVVVIVLVLVHIVLAHVVGFLCVSGCKVYMHSRCSWKQRPVPPLQDLTSLLGTALLARVALYVVGFWWVPTELVVRKKGSAQGGNSQRCVLTMQPGNSLRRNGIHEQETL